MKKPVALIILDGFGYNPNTEGNAIAKAHKPNIDRIFSQNPNTLIKTSGMDVGLPKGQMGNSEVGHTNIGAGRIVYQELTRITKSIEDGDFFSKKEFSDAVNNCIINDSSLHLLGLLSDGGVHSHNTHLYAFLELAKRKGLKKVYIHCFLDGRDVPPDSGRGFVEELQNKTTELGCGRISTVMGRYYAMDRDKRWDRVKLAYDAMVSGIGKKCTDAVEAVEISYKEGKLDEFMLPVVIDESVDARIKENDCVIFFNFRPDRAREITRAFVDDHFDGFERPKGRFHLYYICLTQYDATMPNCVVAYKPETLDNTFGEYISKKGLKQLRIAETEKYAHVTFFFNGGVETVYEGEDRALIPSPKVATYDLKPEMSAVEVTDEVIKRIESDKYDVIILNYANPDMVGHTGIMEAAVCAIETLDKCIGRVIAALEAKKGIALITADHGNAEQMIDYQTGGAFTAHTTNPVPLVITGLGAINPREGILADLAPTILKILGLEIPAEMTGKPLIY